MVEEVQSTSAMELGDEILNESAVKEIHIGEDVSAPNINLTVSINRNLYLDERTADLHFLFEMKDGEVELVAAHKIIVSTGSKVFETMFYGSIPEGVEVKISNATVSAFKEFLQFFYLDKVTLTPQNITEVINLVRQYGIERCMKQCIDFLKETLTNDDIFSGYQLAIQFDLLDLKHFCERKISGNAEEVLKSDGFLNCDGSLLHNILQLNSLVCEYIYLFDAIMSWAKKSCEKNSLDAGEMTNLRKQLNGSMYLIPFRRMKFEDFAARNAEYSGLFTASELTDIIQIIASKKYKSEMFTTKPLSYDIFTWDENRVLECSFERQN